MAGDCSWFTVNKSNVKDNSDLLQFVYYFCTFVYNNIILTKFIVSQVWPLLFLSLLNFFFFFFGNVIVIFIYSEYVL